MIKKYTIDVAAQMNVKLCSIKVVEGRRVGCLDSYLLHLSCHNHLVNVLVYQSDLDALQRGFETESLELRIRNAMLRLKMLSES